MRDLLYEVVAAGFRLWFLVLGWRIDAAGQHHIPASGSVILACNHVSYIDFAFAALSQRRRRVRFMIRSGIMAIPVVGWALRTMGQVEVDPYGDPEPGYRAAREQLVSGEVVGIFPEGTISPSFVPMTGRTGAARLAAQTGAPIVPCAVWGSQRLLTKGRSRNLERGVAILVRYGQPFAVEPDADVRRVTEELMARIGLLVKEEQECYPDRPRDGEDPWWLPAHLGGSAPTPEEAAREIELRNRRRRTGLEEA